MEEPRLIIGVAETETVVRCGRPCQRGRGPCRRPLQWYEAACTAHATEADDDVAYQRLQAATRSGQSATRGGITWTPLTLF